MNLSYTQKDLLLSPNSVSFSEQYEDWNPTKILMMPKNLEEATWWYRVAIDNGWNMFNPNLYRSECVDELRPHHVKAMASLGWNPNQCDNRGEPLWALVLQAPRNGVFSKKQDNSTAWELKKLGANFKCGLPSGDDWMSTWLVGIRDVDEKQKNESLAKKVSIFTNDLIIAESIGLSATLEKKEKWLEWFDLLQERDVDLLNVLLRFATKETSEWLCHQDEGSIEPWVKAEIEVNLLKRQERVLNASRAGTLAL